MKQSPHADPLEDARRRIESLSLWGPRQQMGRRWPIGCVALEITQRCNLDCTACYLSESSEALHDLPLEEVFRRIAAIRRQYGPGVDIQITGGDPTLRRRDELIAIVRQARSCGLRPTLLTNGIRASRTLLRELAAAGLEGVAFHVDTTQERRGYADEAALSAVRYEYLARARGLRLAVYFNTTVHSGNAHEIAQLVQFFVRHSGEVQLASFQLQAATGRGVLGVRPPGITMVSTAAAIRAGAGAKLEFDAMDIGHSRCNRYAAALITNGRSYDVFENVTLVAAVLARTAGTPLNRARPALALLRLTAALVRHPPTLARALGWAMRKAWSMRRDLIAARGRVSKISFFIHDFMDACTLDPGRVKACSFMVQTGAGPESMCAHNAQRDAHLLRPVEIGGRFWDPVSGRTQDSPFVHPVVLVRKNARGRARQAL